MEALLVGLGMTLVSQVFFAIGAVLVVRFVFSEVKRGRAGATLWGNLLAAQITLLITLVSHMLNVACWACLFVLVGEFPNFVEAFYHSAVNYSALGYGDVLMSKHWRLLGPMEAINGVLMFGLSTAMLFAILFRLGEMIHQKQGRI